MLGGCREAVRTIDLPLLVALLILMGAGLAVLHSVNGPVHGQAMRFAGGLVAMWLLSRVSLLRLRAWTPAIYALSMLPLMAVYVIGTGKYGQRWLNLGVFYLQPSELLKLSLPLMMAWYLHRQPLPPSPRTVLTTTVLIGVPAVLILMQPNLGTATLVTASGVFALLLAGLHWGWVATGAAGLAVDWDGSAAQRPTVDLRGVAHLMDVGGGTGAFLAAVGAAHPTMRMTLFDLPAVVPGAVAAGVRRRPAIGWH